jgi:hypothetical protein
MNDCCYYSCATFSVAAEIWIFKTARKIIMPDCILGTQLTSVIRLSLIQSSIKKLLNLGSGSQFDSGPVSVKFVVDKVALVQAFSPVLLLNPIINIPQVSQPHSFIYQ